jgi:glycosyltransferase involved in cell wall biosynthesis
MKIVHVTQYFHPEKGYQENSLALEQVNSGHNVTIICSDDVTLWAASKTEKRAIFRKEKLFMNKTGIKVARVRKIMKVTGRIFTAGLIKRIRREKPDILFLHGVSLPFTLVGLFAYKKQTLCRPKIIIDDHMVNAGSFNSHSSLLYKFFIPCFRLLLNLSKADISKWVAVSSETKDFMIKNYGIKSNIEVIPLGYNEKTCYYDSVAAENWRKESELPAGYNFILYIGKCDNFKNPIDLLPAFKRFAEKNADFALLIVGEVNPQYKISLIEKAHSLNISDKIFLRPPVNNSEIKSVLSLAYMVIWPHGSSMTMLEAMACNCPVIASAIDVNIERLGENRGLMFKNLDDDLFDQMMEVANKRSELISNASKWVSQFSWQSINKEFLKDLL